MRSKQMLERVRMYYRLTKPGIIRGNAINTIAGFFLASRGLPIDWLLLVYTLLGISLIIACACVWNNYIDRDIDAKMERTKQRAIPTGKISGTHAFIFAGILGILGIIVLYLYTNLLALALGLLGVFLYVACYTFAKRVTPYATEIGSLSGAIPPLVGYVAVTGRVDLGGILLFIIITLWQMPHFFAIAIRRKAEYDAAGIPILPSTHGILRTKVHTLLYIVAFGFVTFALAYFGYAGPIYAAVMGIASVLWLVLALRGFKTGDDTKWAKQMFFYSLLVVLSLCTTLILQR